MKNDAVELLVKMIQINIIFESINYQIIPTMTELTAELEKVQWDNIQDSFVVFDVETTGLDSKSDRVLEIGAVLFEKSSYLSTGEVKTFQCFIKQNKPIPPEATAINKITDEMVANGEDEYKALELFFEFVGNNDLYAYNAKFDKSFINAMAKRSRYAHEPVIDKVFDILKYVRDEYTVKPNYKLTTVAKQLKIDTSDSHRAVGDSVLALKVYTNIVQQMNMIRRKMEIDHDEWCKNNLSIYKNQESSNNPDLKNTNPSQDSRMPVREESQWEVMITRVGIMLGVILFIILPVVSLSLK